MTKFIATFGFVGLIPFAPGTFGSLAALPFAWLLIVGTGPVGVIVASALVFGLGWWATGLETAGAGDHDPGEIVIDEVVGQWLAVLPMAFGVTVIGNFGVTLVVGFVLFRAFDILKPFPISWADGLHTPFGVMFDDVLAGLAAALCLWILAGLLP